MAGLKNCFAAFSAIHKTVNRNVCQKLMLIGSNILPDSTKVLNKSSMHTAASRVGIQLLNNNSVISMNSYSMNSEKLALSSNYISVRHLGKKGKWAVGPTKNRTGRPRGKARGLKVYDGQRIPHGTMLVNQLRPVIYPGWNVSLFKYNLDKSGASNRIIIQSLNKFFDIFELRFDLDGPTSYMPRLMAV